MTNQVVNHIDGDSTNNDHDNLEIVIVQVLCHYCNAPIELDDDGDGPFWIHADGFYTCVASDMPWTQAKPKEGTE